jgi:hypothetical protein
VTQRKTAPSKAPKKTSKKAAPKKSATARGGQRKASPGSAEELIQINITPPDLASDTDASRVDGLLADRASRPGPIALSKLPWLRQNVAYRVGYHMMTHGLQEHAGHPEIEVCNVPGVLVRPMGTILNQLAAYVLTTGKKLLPGQTMSLTSSEDPLLGVMSFRRIRPGKGGMDHEVDVLRLLFLR